MMEVRHCQCLNKSQHQAWRLRVEFVFKKVLSDIFRETMYNYEFVKMFQAFEYNELYILADGNKRYNLDYICNDTFLNHETYELKKCLLATVE